MTDSHDNDAAAPLKSPVSGAPFNPCHVWESIAALGFDANIDKAGFIKRQEWDDEDYRQRLEYVEAIAQTWDSINAKRLVRCEKGDRDLLRWYEESKEEQRKAAERLEKSGWEPMGALRHLLGFDEKSTGGLHEEG